MANLLARLRGDRSPSRSDPALSWDAYQQMVSEFFTFGGLQYPILNQTYTPTSIEGPTSDLPGYAALTRACPPAFAAQLVRSMILSQARFVFRNNRRSRNPGRTFGTSALGLLEEPWPNATTGELLSRMEWHAGLQGNAYVLRQSDRLRVLRPDWVTIVYGSRRDPDEALHELDADLLGYVYQKGGAASRSRPQFLLPEEVAHWSPIPDPEGPGLGMSWFTPAIREALGDRVVTEHKLKFFEQGATPNLVVKGIDAATKEQFDDAVAMIKASHEGVRNAYRTLFLNGGADATVVGSNLKDLDLKAVQGGFETRVAYLSRVPAVILSIAEGMQGSALNAGNYGQARRNFADSWVYPTLQDLSSALSSIVNVPADADLWFDTTDMPFLREDERDAAEIRQKDAVTIRQLVEAGAEWDAAIAYVQSSDLGELKGKHTGLFSVQLQPAGTEAAQPAGATDEPAPAGT